MSNHPETCFACGDGHYQEVIEDYRLDLPEGETLTVPKLLILRCGKCGEDTIPPESSRRIETAVEQHQDTLPVAAIRSFLEQFQIDQTEAAEALGMGGKTLHRWARGTQRVSRSMGYFLRARNWRENAPDNQLPSSRQVARRWSGFDFARRVASGGP